MSTPAAAIPARPPIQSRMALSNITRGKQGGPLRIGEYGLDGVGKSSFAAAAPNPIFLPTEDRIRHIDAAKFPVAQNWQEVLDAARLLTADAQGFKTFILDGLDWTEPLLWAELCRRDNVKTKEDVGGGYGKWVDAAVAEWRVLLGALERLQAKQGMNIILIGHAVVRNFKNPEGEDFERYVLKINEKAAGVVREWVDSLYFARYEAHAVKDQRTKRVKGISTGDRVLHTRWTAAYDAKDSYGLPETIALSWDAFEQARAAADPQSMRADCEAKAKDLGGEIEKATMEILGRAGADMARLIQLRDRLDVRLAERDEQAAATAAPASAANQ